MGRPSEVSVRQVTLTEGRRLWRIGRPAKDPVRLRRAIGAAADLPARPVLLPGSRAGIRHLSFNQAGGTQAVTGVAVVSRESIHQILHGAGINWLATKTLKASTDPQLIAKMHRGPGSLRPPSAALARHHHARTRCARSAATRDGRSTRSEPPSRPTASSPSAHMAPGHSRTPG